MKYLVASDIHLGHLKTPTAHIIRSFKKSILNDKNKDIRVLFIGGDFFDRLIDLNSKDIQVIIEFFHYLLNYCHKHDILLRILEGTPSHDWEQSKLIVNLNDIRTHPVDLKYFKILDIEYIERYNQYVLYVPDEWCHDHKDLEKQIQQKLMEMHISQVDIAIMHGAFRFQLQGRKYNGFFFDEEFFLNTVKGFIHVGHYHTHSHLERIIANGSLERLAHGEEEAKGFVIVDGDKWAFVENQQSYTYKTIKVNANTTIDRLDKMINSFPEGSFIRLFMNKDHPFNLTFQELRVRYTNYNVKKLIKEHISEASTVTYIITDAELDMDDKFILDGDLHQLLFDSIEAKHQLTAIERSKLIGYISVFKETAVNEPVAF